VDCTGFTSCDDKDTAWRILGGYQVNRNFAAEFGYHDLGKATFSGPGGGDLKANAWELVAIGAFPFANQFAVYGKLGFFRGEVKGFGDKDTNSDLTYGLGVSYDITRQFAVRGEWQRYKDVGGGDFGKSDIDVLNVGVLFRIR
jgi:OOP family OmpA-OmpF porin